mmetsp:Transcript_6429/g.13473  ORF Transcript_6429/g.13473 Transcript_6429/m.13473 type:complete len:541 (+) Transcript_6429:48-1670(+)
MIQKKERKNNAHPTGGRPPCPSPPRAAVLPRPPYLRLPTLSLRRSTSGRRRPSPVRHGAVPRVLSGRVVPPLQRFRGLGGGAHCRGLLGLFYHVLRILVGELLALGLGQRGHDGHLRPGLDGRGADTVALGGACRLALPHKLDTQDPDRLRPGQPLVHPRAGVREQFPAHALQRLVDVLDVEGPRQLQDDRERFLQPFRGHGGLFALDLLVLLVGDGGRRRVASFFSDGGGAGLVALDRLHVLHGLLAEARGLESGTGQREILSADVGALLDPGPVALDGHEGGLPEANVFLRFEPHGESHGGEKDAAEGALTDFDGLLVTGFGKEVDVQALFDVGSDAFAEGGGTTDLPFALFPFGRLPGLFGGFGVHLRADIGGGGIEGLVAVGRPDVLEDGIGRAGDPELPDVGLDEVAPEHDREEDLGIDLVVQQPPGPVGVRLPVLVVGRPELLVAQGVVGRPQRLELVGGVRVPDALVGVALARLLVVRLLDLGGGRPGGHAQQVVVLAVLHLALVAPLGAQGGRRIGAGLRLLPLDLLPLVVQ